MLAWLRAHLLSALALCAFAAALIAFVYFLAVPNCPAGTSCSAAGKYGIPGLLLGIALLSLSAAAMIFWMTSAKSAKPFRSLIGYGPKGALLRLQKIELKPMEADAEHPKDQYELVLTWNNFGRSQATVSRIGVGSLIAAAPPHTPMYRFFEGSPVNAVVDNSEEYVFRATNQVAGTQDQRSRIDLGVVHQWLWCEIRYENGQGSNIEHGFIAQRRGNRSRWRMRGPRAYSYTRSRPAA